MFGNFRRESFGRLTVLPNYRFHFDFVDSDERNRHCHKRRDFQVVGRPYFNLRRVFVVGLCRFLRNLIRAANRFELFVGEKFFCHVNRLLKFF